MSRGFKLSLVVLAMVAIAYFVPWGFLGPTATGILRHVEPRQPEVRQSHLLAYTAQDDQSEHESAFLLLELSRGDWRLLIVHRGLDHRSGERRSWSCFSRVADAPDWQGWQDFTTLPTASEVDAFLRDRGWSFQPGYTYHFRRAELYTETWKRVLGYVPSYRFTPPV
jgi:hypothetical protein